MDDLRFAVRCCSDDLKRKEIGSAGDSSYGVYEVGTLSWNLLGPWSIVCMLAFIA